MSAVNDYKEKYRYSAADLGPVLTVLKHGCHKLGSKDPFQWLPLVPTHWSPVGLILSLSGVQLDNRQGSSRRSFGVGSFMYLPVAISILFGPRGRCVEAGGLF
jgi:hypothetical protein